MLTVRGNDSVPIPQLCEEVGLDVRIEICQRPRERIGAILDVLDAAFIPGVTTREEVDAAIGQYRVEVNERPIIGHVNEIYAFRSGTKYFLEFDGDGVLFRIGYV